MTQISWDIPRLERRLPLQSSHCCWDRKEYQSLIRSTLTLLNQGQQIYLIKTQIVANLTEWDLFFCLKLELKHSEVFFCRTKGELRFCQPDEWRWRFRQENCYFMQNKRNVTRDGFNFCFCNLNGKFADSVITRTKTEQLKLRSGLVLVPLFKHQIR